MEKLSKNNKVCELKGLWVDIHDKLVSLNAIESAQSLRAATSKTDSAAKMRCRSARVPAGQGQEVPGLPLGGGCNAHWHFHTLRHGACHASLHKIFGRVRVCKPSDLAEVTKPPRQREPPGSGRRSSPDNGQPPQRVVHHQVQEQSPRRVTPKVKDVQPTSAASCHWRCWRGAGRRTTLS